MKKSKIRFLVPLILTVIPAIALAVFLFSEVFLSNEEVSTVEKIMIVLMCVLSFLSLVSLIFIQKYNIDYMRAYVRTFITDILLLLSIIPIAWIWLMGVDSFDRRPEDSFPMVAITYMIFCISVIVNRVRLTLREQSKSQTDKPKLLHILTITFINPLLPFLPFLMEIAYLIVTFDGLNL